MKKIKKNFTVLKTPDQIGEALGLNKCEITLMKHKAELSHLAIKAIEKSELTVNEIVVNSGVARSKVSAIKNGAISGISCDLFIKIISATGAKLKFSIAS